MKDEWNGLNIICDDCGYPMEQGGIEVTDDIAICIYCIKELYFTLYPKPEVKEEIIIIRRKITENMRDRVFKRDSYKCTKCPSKEDLTIDHKKAFSKGGKTIVRNFQTLCRSCNSKKGTKEDGS